MYQEGCLETLIGDDKYYSYLSAVPVYILYQMAVLISAKEKGGMSTLKTSAGKKGEIFVQVSGCLPNCCQNFTLWTELILFSCKKYVTHRNYNGNVNHCLCMCLFYGMTKPL